VIKICEDVNEFQINFDTITYSFGRLHNFRWKTVVVKGEGEIINSFGEPDFIG
jgi:hypothetical protein